MQWIRSKRKLEILVLNLIGPSFKSVGNCTIKRPSFSELPRGKLGAFYWLKEEAGITSSAGTRFRLRARRKSVFICYNPAVARKRHISCPGVGHIYPDLTRSRTLPGAARLQRTWALA